MAKVLAIAIALSGIFFVVLARPQEEPAPEATTPAAGGSSSTPAAGTNPACEQYNKLCTGGSPVDQAPIPIGGMIPGGNPVGGVVNGTQGAQCEALAKQCPQVPANPEIPGGAGNGTNPAVPNLPPVGGVPVNGSMPGVPPVEIPGGGKLPIGNDTLPGGVQMPGVPNLPVGGR